MQMSWHENSRFARLGGGKMLVTQSKLSLVLQFATQGYQSHALLYNLRHGRLS